jgi:hypothetical protein
LFAQFVAIHFRDIAACFGRLGRFPLETSAHNLRQSSEWH